MILLLIREVLPHVSCISFNPLRLLLTTNTEQNENTLRRWDQVLISIFAFADVKWQTVSNPVKYGTTTQWSERNYGSVFFFLLERNLLLIHKSLNYLSENHRSYSNLLSSQMQVRVSTTNRGFLRLVMTPGSKKFG